MLVRKRIRQRGEGDENLSEDERRSSPLLSSMNKRTKNHARLLHVALLDLPDTLLLQVIEQWWAYAHRQTRNIVLSDRERLALGYRAGPSSGIAPDPPEL